jgi:nicotinamide mononucleotide transporter
MNPIFDFFTDPYKQFATSEIVLESTAVITGLLSVWFAKQNKIWVYPTGLISTGLYVYLLLNVGLIGDFLINAYYFIMSIYGWVFWTQTKDGVVLNQIEQMTFAEKKWSISLFVLSIAFVGTLYGLLGNQYNWMVLLDTLTTALFFVGMWLMARRKIAHWIYWIIGDLISIPLYLFKGLALTSFQYLIFTLIAIFGYIEWRKVYNSRIRTA